MIDETGLPEARDREGRRREICARALREIGAWKDLALPVSGAALSSAALQGR